MLYHCLVCVGMGEPPDGSVKIEVLEQQSNGCVAEHGHFKCEGGIMWNIGDRHWLGIAHLSQIAIIFLTGH